MHYLTDFLLPMLVAVLTGVSSSWITVHIALARHDERLKGLREAIDAVKQSVDIVRGMASTAHRRIDRLIEGKIGG